MVYLAFAFNSLINFRTNFITNSKIGIHNCFNCKRKQGVPSKTHKSYSPIAQILVRSWNSSISIATRLYNSWQGQEIFHFSLKPRPGLGATQPPIQWALGAVSPGIKVQGHDADHSPQLLQISRMLELYFHTTIRLHFMVLNNEAQGCYLFTLVGFRPTVLSCFILFLRITLYLATHSA